MNVIGHCRELLKIDTSNPGSTEEIAAAYVADTLAAAGIRAEVFEPSPGRCSVIARHEGREPDLPALVVHCHLDVVPAEARRWKHDPFGGIEADGFLWGRGAVDMKDVAAMMLVTETELGSAAVKPRRNLVFAYFADEEMGGGWGSKWITSNHPEVFAGAAEAVGEFGGFTVTLPNGARIYPVQVAERGLCWMRITIPGRAGHAALESGVNPLPRLAELIQKVDGLRTDDQPPRAYRHLVHRLSELLEKSAEQVEATLDKLGTFGTIARPAGMTRFVPTMTAAGEKANVIPSEATLVVDCRFVPGGRHHALETLQRALDDDMSLEILAEMPGAESPMSGPFIEACTRTIERVDPEGEVIPFITPAGTDAQHLAALGISGYGFTPLLLSADYDYSAMYHAVDERIPVKALVEGERLFNQLIMSY